MVDFGEYDPEFVPTAREPVLHNGLCYILLSNGKIAFCDAEYYNLVYHQKHWGSRRGYVGYSYWAGNGKYGFELLHKLIHPDWVMTDHRNGNRLDCRRDNLRECNASQNNVNRQGWGKTSKYKGVKWDKIKRKWRGRIVSNGKERYLGLFASEEDAARAYDKAAKELFGGFAWMNFPNGNIQNENGLKISG